MARLLPNGKVPIRTGTTRQVRIALSKNLRENAFSSATPTSLREKTNAVMGVKTDNNNSVTSFGKAISGGATMTSPYSDKVNYPDRAANWMWDHYVNDTGDATSRLVQDTSGEITRGLGYDLGDNYFNGKGKSGLIANGDVSLTDVARRPDAALASFVFNNFMNNSDVSQALAPGDFSGVEGLAKTSGMGVLKLAKNPIVRAGVKGAFEAGLSPKNQLVRQLHMGVDPSEAVSVFKDMFRGGKDAIANERFMQGNQHGETDVLSQAQEAALKQIDMPEVNSLKYTVHDARDLVDTPQIVSGSARKKRVGEIPVHIDSQETANQIFFGDNVMNAGRVGHSVSSNPDFVGTTAHVGKKINFVQLAKDQVAVARNGVKQRYGNRAPVNGAGPKVRASWAINSLNNFVRDFGEGAARILRSEGRKSISGEFDEASTIPQTIQHDHTVVSPTDLKAFEEETKVMKKELGSSHPDIKERVKVARDMSVILADSRNLVPVHRNPNILFSSFDRERLLNDPEFANQVGINEDNLGDIWRIMSDSNSGYRKSVNDAYSFARQGGRESSVAYWQDWQHSNLQKTLTRRNQRLAQAGIKLD